MYLLKKNYNKSPDLFHMKSGQLLRYGCPNMKLVVFHIHHLLIENNMIFQNKYYNNSNIIASITCA